MKFWPFPIVRVHNTNSDLSKLFLMFAHADDLEVLERGDYETVVRCHHGKMFFWSANAFYGWAQCGLYTGSYGIELSWKNEMPSRYAVRAMAKAINWKEPVKKRFKLEGV